MRRRLRISTEYIDTDELDALQSIDISEDEMSDAIIEFASKFGEEHRFVISDLIERGVFEESIDKWFVVSGDIYFVGDTLKDAYDKMRAVDPDSCPYVSKVQTPREFMRDWNRWQELKYQL